MKDKDNSMYWLMFGDCLERLKEIPAGSVDMILTDPPYGTTSCKWDSIIPLDKMWEQLKRVIKSNGAIVIFGAEPFTANLICSNLKNFKYNWIWKKDKATNHLNAKKQPMRITENISVFYSKPCTYKPILKNKLKRNIRPPTLIRNNSDVYGHMSKVSKRVIPINKSYPNNILKFKACFGTKGASSHPTQKPVDLLEYLIKTYTNENEIVLDFTFGSCSTGVACMNTRRQFIGIEKDKSYFKVGYNRIREAYKINKG